jgi:hypothetical protein
LTIIEILPYNIFRNPLNRQLLLRLRFRHDFL